MKTIIQRNHDAGTPNGGGNAGSNLDGLGVGDDANLNNSTTVASTPAASNEPSAGTPPAETSEAKLARETAEKAAADAKALEDANKNAPQAVEIDGVQYQLDKDGNAIDKDGKITKTKAELDALESADELPLTDEILQKSGLQILDEKGQPKKYEDTPEGLLALSNDIAAEKSKGLIKQFFDTFPDVEDFALHLQRGGNKEDYFKKQTESWSNFKLDDKDDSQLTSVVVADLMNTGMSKEQAEATAKLYKDTDKLKEFGKAAYTRLTNFEKAQNAENQKAYDAEVAREKAMIDAHWENVKTVVKKGTLQHITIPETDRDAFFSYVAMDADGNGNSKATLDKQKMPVEIQLQLDYLQFKGFDLKTLITNAVKSEQVRTLRLRTKSGQSGVGGGEGIDKARLTKPNDADINVDMLN